MQIRPFQAKWIEQPKQRFYYLEAEPEFRPDRLLALAEEGACIHCGIVGGRIIAVLHCEAEPVGEPEALLVRSLWLAPEYRGREEADAVLGYVEHLSHKLGRKRVLVTEQVRAAAGSIEELQKAEPISVRCGEELLPLYEYSIDPHANYLPLGLSLGTALGMILGLLFRQLLLGACIGMVAGLVGGLLFGGIRLKKHQAQEPEGEQPPTNEARSAQRPQDPAQNRYDTADSSADAEAIPSSGGGADQP